MAMILLTLAICVLSVVEGAIMEIESCPIPQYLLDKKEIEWNNITLQLSMDIEGIKFYANPEENMTDFRGNEFTIEILEMRKSDTGVNAKRIIFSQSDKQISGVAHRRTPERGSIFNPISNCHVMFSMHHEEVIGPMRIISSDLEKIFQTCIEETICKDNRRIKTSDFLTRNNMSPAQSFANRLVDAGMNQIFEAMGMTAPNYTIPIQDFTYEFPSTGMGKKIISGKRGRIGNMKEFKRISEVYLSRGTAPEQYVTSCTFGIEKMNLHIDDFEMSMYGDIHGRLTAEISNLHVDMKGWLYESRAFSLPLIDEVKLVSYQIVKIEVAGHLPALMNRLRIEWTKDSKILSKIEGVIRNTIRDQFKAFDKEKFRKSVSLN